MKLKRMAALLLTAAMTVSMAAPASACMPKKELTVEKIEVEAHMGNGAKEVQSIAITVNSPVYLLGLKASDFDIHGNTGSAWFDPETDATWQEYEDDGITLTRKGRTLTLNVKPFDLNGAPTPAFTKTGWSVECSKYPELSFTSEDVTSVHTNILDEAIRGTYTAAGLTREYALYIPKNADGTNKKNVPLTIWNIGGGEYAAALETSLTANRGLTAWNDEGYETAVLVLQVSNPNYSYLTGKGAPEVRNDLPDTEADKIERRKLIDQNNALQAAIVRDLIADGTVDASRVYVTGASSGGGATMRFLLQYPEMFAGAIAMCSMDPIVWVHKNDRDDLVTLTKNFEEAFCDIVYTWDEASQQMVEKKIDTNTLLNVPIYFTHAQNDPTCSINSSRAMFAAMNNLGDNNNKLLIYSDADMEKIGVSSSALGGVFLHWSWCAVFNDSGEGSPMHWLYQQHK